MSDGQVKNTVQDYFSLNACSPPCIHGSNHTRYSLSVSNIHDAMCIVYYCDVHICIFDSALLL